MYTWPPSAVFLDRDGVLIENVPTYVRTWEDVSFFDQALKAVAELTRLNIPLIVVTNQASVGRKIMGLDEVIWMNTKILNELERLGPAQLTAAYMCPHHPDDDCDCRKPRPGMLLRAANQHNIDLTKAVMVGDAVTDLQAAEAAGVYGVLVRTGRGREQEEAMRKANLDRPVFDDLLSAVEAKFGQFPSS